LLSIRITTGGPHKNASRSAASGTTCWRKSRVTKPLETVAALLQEILGNRADWRDSDPERQV
jgi:hypothetical protein